MHRPFFGGKAAPRVRYGATGVPSNARISHGNFDLGVSAWPRMRRLGGKVAVVRWPGRRFDRLQSFATELRDAISQPVAAVSTRPNEQAPATASQLPNAKRGATVSDLRGSDA